jgi:hypothetical protein
VDDPPVAVPDAASTAEDTLVTIAVLANDADIDGGPISVGGVTNSGFGTVAITGGGTGVRYTPNADSCGLETFTYSYTDLRSR